ncbi:MAG: MFS transporter [Chlamydiales bacterium]|nr:MFS transporter [Chlamydiales bacterium]
MKHHRQKLLHLLSPLIGNLFENYDNALFALLSPYLAHLFFPEQDQTVALILTYAIIPISALAYPIGALFFGYIGDMHGKQHALFLTMSGMAAVTMAMAFLPTYASIGMAAPLLLSLGRMLQNFFASGETVGGALYLLEHTPEKQRNFLSSIFACSTVAGILVGSAAVGILANANMVETCWRYLFMFGGITALVGLYIRSQQEKEHDNTPKKITIIDNIKVLWQERRPLMQVIIVSGFSWACYFIALVVINGLIPLVTDITEAEAVSMNTSLVVLDFVLLPVFGYCATIWTREKVMLAATLVTVVAGMPLFLWLQDANLVTVMVIRSIFVMIGVGYCASYHAWARAQVPEHCRYSLLSFGYAMGGQLFGGPTAVITLWLYHATGKIWLASIWWIGVAILAAFALAFNKSVAAIEGKMIKSPSLLSN